MLPGNTHEGFLREAGKPTRTKASGFFQTDWRAAVTGDESVDSAGLSPAFPSALWCWRRLHSAALAAGTSGGVFIDC